jgi:N-methylhydantoinase A
VITRGARLAVDVGGTFTDVVAIDQEGRVVTDKVLSTTETISIAAERVVRDVLAATRREQLAAIMHGSTVASNALLERTVATVGLVTTEGFRDELEIRRQSRPAIYDFAWQRPPPLVPRRQRLEVPERIDADGKVRRPLDRSATEAALGLLAALRVESIAVSLINAYANAEHEREIRVLAAELLPGVPVCLSSDVLPQVREFERVSTVCVNASLVPVVTAYLGELEERFAGYSPVVRIMQSNGGLMTLSEAKRAPVRMVESGPAAGVLAAAALCRDLGLDRAIAFDMGGTTAKACLVEDGTPIERTDYEVGGDAHLSARYSHGVGYMISVPALDIVEIGAGGGSIAHIEDGALRVGPQSAGADPGPVCYARGGARPTVTDANVTLGYINPSAIADGAVPIDHHAAETVIANELGDALARPVEECALGIHQVANAAMLRAIRSVTSERGRDPRQYTMIAFGGSGPVHAAALAALAGVQTVYVPPIPGLFSAVGLLQADLRYDAVTAWIGELEAADVADRLGAAFSGLAERLREEASDEGTDPQSLRFERHVDVRYAGQSTETTLLVPEDFEWSTAGPALSRMYHAEHLRRFGYASDSERVVVMALRLTAWVPRDEEILWSEVGRRLANASPETEEPATPLRRAYFGGDVGWAEATLMTRRDLMGAPCRGPLIVEEPTTTVVVPPDWSVECDEHGNLVLRRAEGDTGG